MILVMEVTVRQTIRPSIAFQAVGHMPCKCGGTKWLMLIEPAGADPETSVNLADGGEHDLRTFECPRCQQLETLIVKFK
jgi:hypothetical protein